MQTFIGKSIAQNGSNVSNDFFSTELLKTALDSINNGGFLRSLMMPRFMEVLMDTKSYEREFFVNALILSEDIKILDEAKNLIGFDITNFPIILIGNKRRCKIFEKLLENKKNNLNVKSVYDKGLIEEFVIEGGKRIIEKIKDKL